VRDLLGVLTSGISINGALCGRIHVKTGGIPAEMAVAVVAPDGSMLDDRGWNEQFGGAPDALGDVNALVQRWLAEGEGLALEFKQDLKADSARNSFAETIAAFPTVRADQSSWESVTTAQWSDTGRERWPIRSQTLPER
jgi:hypothetical protein